MRKLNIAILSDSPMLTTGYSDQGKYLGNLLVENGHNVLYFANTYMGQNLIPPITFEDGRQLNFKIIGQSMKNYFQDTLSMYLKQYKIDILVILFDTFMLYPWILNQDLSPAKSVFWFPSDGGAGMPVGCERVLQKMDKPIAMAKFGQKQMKKVHNLDVHHIPHCVDTENYYPYTLEQKKELRKNFGLDDKFVIGVVARNQGRKMLDRTIKMMALYSKINPNAILYMHLDPDDPAQVFPMKEMINRYGLENRVIFSGMKYYKGFDFKQMNEVYNLMDVFLLTTSGEGFGIPLIEAQACGIPVLATNYTTTKELVIDSDAGLGINLVGTDEDENPEVHGYEIIDGSLTGSWAVERGICSIKDGVNKLDYLAKNITERERLGKNGRINALENYNIEKLNKMWLDVIEELGGKY